MPKINVNKGGRDLHRPLDHPNIDSEVRHEYCSSEQGLLLRPMIRIVRASPLKPIIPSKVHRSTFALLIARQRLGDFLVFHTIA